MFSDDRTKEILRYLKIKAPDSETLRLIMECESELAGVISVKYVYKLLDRQQCKKVLIGSDMLALVKDCNKVALMAVTLSSGVDRLIRKYETCDMQKASVLNASANAMIEEAADICEKELRSSFSRYAFSRRFSPGYGDCPLSVQSELVSVLNAERMAGITVSKSFMLNPLKSVTAVLGASEGGSERMCEEKNRCISCTSQNNCEFKRV